MKKSQTKNSRVNRSEVYFFLAVFTFDEFLSTKTIVCPSIEANNQERNNFDFVKVFELKKPNQLPRKIQLKLLLRHPKDLDYSEDTTIKFYFQVNF